MDAFIENTLNALPQILLTAIFSGVLVYLFQKWIESRNQKSMLTFQTRLSKTYPKTLEVLEVFVQKFTEFSWAYSGLTNKLKMLIRSDIAITKKLSSEFPVYSLNKEEIDKDFERTGDTLTDCSVYFRNNRFYLPNNSVKQIKEALERMNNLRRFLSAYLHYKDSKTPEQFIELVWKIIKAGHFKFPDEQALVSASEMEDGHILLHYLSILLIFEK